MNPQKNKKGFTIVELTIVIAVIAILAAVLIPTFTGLVKKADRSADVQMVVNLNKYLAAMENLDGKNETMADAMADAAETGYGLDAFRQDGDITILWNRETDRFLAVEDGKIITADETAEYEYDGEMIADKKGEALCDVKSIYWTISNQISDTYATYLTGDSAFSSGEPVEIELGLDTTAYKGEYQKINVKVSGYSLILNGVFHTVSADDYTNPEIYGYVYELTGNAVSKNATFHMKETVAQSEGNTVKTEANATGTITGSYIVAHLVKESGGCHFCTSSEVQEYKHTHEWTKNDVLSDPPKCEEEGKVYYKCSSSETCQAIKVDTIDALKHDWLDYGSDNINHWPKCTLCKKEQTLNKYKVVHTFDLTSYSCTACGYKVSDTDKVVYEKAIALNEALRTNTYPTMYDTFYALSGTTVDKDTTDTSQLQTINGAIDAVIQQIKTAERGTNLMILWDQTNGRFAVAKKENGKTYVLYAAEGGQSGEVTDTYLLWDTYDTLSYVQNYTGVQNDGFSIYWAGKDAPSDWWKDEKQSKYIHVGFDMGTWQSDGTSNHRVVFYVYTFGSTKQKAVIIRTKGTIPETVDDSNNDKITLACSSVGYVKHYGSIAEVEFNKNCEYYEYGTFKKIRVKQNVTGTFHTNKESTSIEYLTGTGLVGSIKIGSLDD